MTYDVCSVITDLEYIYIHIYNDVYIQYIFYVHFHWLLPVIY